MTAGNPVSLTHAEVNRRFALLDHEPVMLATEFDGWLAWPVVKERLWMLAMGADGAGAPGQRLAENMVSRLVRGVVDLARLLRRPKKSLGSALLYERRDVLLPDGSAIHPHLGTLGTEDGGNLHYVYAWTRTGAAAAGHRVFEDRHLGALCAAAARLARGHGAFQGPARRLALVFAGHHPEVALEDAIAVAADQLARFAIRRRLFERIFARQGVQRIVVLDPDAKTAEIAAARSLGLPAVEVQHGIFSTGDPEYSWTSRHRAVDAPMALPDGVVVFGERWKQMLARQGYWRDAELVEAVSPAMEAFRRVHDDWLADGPAAVHLLFATQDHVREHAIEFFSAVLPQWRAGGLGEVKLIIKTHPREDLSDGRYQRLVEAYPEHCELVASGVDGLHALARSHVVVGYSSLLLLEAMAIGVPVITIRGGAIADGFVETFELHELRPVIEDVATPEAFVEVLRRNVLDGRHADWAERVRALGARVFDREGPSVAAAIRTLSSTVADR